ncbi:MAG: hypothetical protein PVJ21_03625 [Anaerolineales bacterium]|jgi:hypothetical protein
MAKIFVRERNRVEKGEGLPRFAVVGVQGSDLKFFQVHVRKSELDAIAEAVGAEVVMLPRGTGENIGEGSGGGKRQKRGGRKRKHKKDA